MIEREGRAKVCWYVGGESRVVSGIGIPRSFLVSWFDGLYCVDGRVRVYGSGSGGSVL